MTSSARISEIANPKKIYLAKSRLVVAKALEPSKDPKKFLLTEFHPLACPAAYFEARKPLPGDCEQHRQGHEDACHGLGGSERQGNPASVACLQHHEKTQRKTKTRKRQTKKENPKIRVTADVTGGCDRIQDERGARSCVCLAFI